MKSQIFRWGIILILFIGALSAQKIWYKFFAKSRLYDARYNVERERRGILPLPADWITHDKTEDGKSWVPPHPDTNSVYRAAKIVVVKEGEITDELDRIVKRRKAGYDVLEIYSHYDKANLKDFVYRDYEKPKGDTVTKSQADSILQSWNFK